MDTREKEALKVYLEKWDYPEIQVTPVFLVTVQIVENLAILARRVYQVIQVRWDFQEKWGLLDTEVHLEMLDHKENKVLLVCQDFLGLMDLLAILVNLECVDMMALEVL